MVPTISPAHMGMAAHEYAHLVMHAAGVHLPPWLGEGLADVFSTIQITRCSAQIGGEPFGRTRVLHSQAWLPLEILLSLPPDSPIRKGSDGNAAALARIRAEVS